MNFGYTQTKKLKTVAEITCGAKTGLISVPNTCLFFSSFFVQFYSFLLFFVMKTMQLGHSGLSPFSLRTGDFCYCLWQSYSIFIRLCFFLLILFSLFLLIIVVNFLFMSTVHCTKTEAL